MSLKWQDLGLSLIIFPSVFSLRYSRRIKGINEILLMSADKPHRALPEMQQHLTDWPLAGNYECSLLVFISGMYMWYVGFYLLLCSFNVNPSNVAAHECNHRQQRRTESRALLGDQMAGIMNDFVLLPGSVDVLLWRLTKTAERSCY